MKHSEYIELTSLLKGFSDNSGTLRLVFSKVEAPADPDTLEPGRPATKPVPSDQAKQHPGYRFRYRMLDNEEMAIRETLELMDGTVDTWTDENQARADKGLGPTADVRELYSAMSDFLVATETPIDGAGVLYDRIRKKCIVWMDQAVTWFPELVPFLPKLLDTELCKLAVQKGEMIWPVTWNGTIKALAVLLEQTHVLDKIEQDKVASSTGGPGSTHWILADRVFRKKGKPITARQLKESITH